MAIESICDGIFSIQSDVWSFGVVLWELFTLAKAPYPGIDTGTLYSKLIAGYQLETLEYATKEIYNIMTQCWQAEPKLRPTFTSLVYNLGEFLDGSVRNQFVGLNSTYLDMNKINHKDTKKDYLMMMSVPDHAVLSSPTATYVNKSTANGSISSNCMRPTGKNYVLPKQQFENHLYLKMNK